MAMNADDGEYATSNTPEQRQGCMAPNDMRKDSSHLYWEIDFSQSGNGRHEIQPCSASNDVGRYAKTYPSLGASADESKVNKPSNNHPSENFPPKADDKNDSSSKCAEEHQIASSDDDIPVSSMPKHGQSASSPSHQSGELAGKSGLETQYPAKQVMEHPADSASSSSYRIPSYVFARQTTTPEGWSLASNESLFSIHTGNMSFSRDAYLIDKSGEINVPSTHANMSGTLTDVSSSRTSSDQKSNSIYVSPDESKTTEAKAEETMREVIRENTQNLRQDNPDADSDAKPSHRSNPVKQSFAFPILTDVERHSSGKVDRDKQNNEVHSQPHIQEEHPDEAREPKSTKAGTSNTNRWFSCFCCCGS